MPKNQLEIPTMERPKIKAIEDTAQDYVTIRDKRMKLTEQEIVAKASLIETMLKHEDKLCVDGEGNRIYRFDDEVVLLSQKTGVKVRHAADPDDDDED